MTNANGHFSLVCMMVYIVRYGSGPERHARAGSQTLNSELAISGLEFQAPSNPSCWTGLPVTK